MKQLPDRTESQKLVEITKKLEQQIQEQCQLAGEIFNKYQTRLEKEKIKTDKGE